MALTWSSITSWDPGPLDNAATDLYQASKGLREAYDTGEGAVCAVRSEGVAVLAMRAATSKNLSTLEQALTNVNGALMAIEGARDGVATIKARVEDAMAYASAKNCTIASDGSVNCTPTDAVDKQAIIDARTSKITLTEKVKTILEDAERVDSELCSALKAVNTDTYTDGDGADNKVVGVPDFPQANWSPSQNAAWWRALPEERKRFLTEHCPDDIRHLDGLPATIRDEANRNALYGYVDAYGNKRQGALADAKQAAEEAKTEYRIAYGRRSLFPGLKQLYSDENAAKLKLDQAEKVLNDLETLEKQINNDGRKEDDPARRYLLDFNYDTKHHRSTAIVASGNPDTASYVSTLVPGIGTNVQDSLPEYMDINDRLRAQTRHAGLDPNNVATISYLGYVAPEGPGPKLYQAANIDYANEGAPKVARFMEGLRAHGNANNHSFLNTLLTHSYGSTTGGIAATQTAPGTIDRLILTGSPGSGVQSIDQYNVPKGHVYESSAYAGDMVEGLGTDGSYGKNPQKLEGMSHISGDVSDTDLNRRLFRIFPNPKFEATSTSFHPLSNHSEYFKEGSRAAEDIAHILAGKEPTTDAQWAAIQAERRK